MFAHGEYTKARDVVLWSALVYQLPAKFLLDNPLLDFSCEYETNTSILSVTVANIIYSAPRISGTVNNQMYEEKNRNT